MAEMNQNNNYYRFLYHLILTFKPEVMFEIGTMHGIASAYMCSAAKDYGGRVIAIDLKTYKLVSEILPERFDKFHFLRMNSLKALYAVKRLSRYGKLGLVFQDSSHHYRASCQEWNIYSPLVDNGGVWLCDDITPAFYNIHTDPPGKGMVQYFEERPGEKELFPDVLHYGNTMGVILL